MTMHGWLFLQKYGTSKSKFYNWTEKKTKMSHKFCNNRVCVCESIEWEPTWDGYGLVG
jgi:hypothetical protein